MKRKGQGSERDGMSLRMNEWSASVTSAGEYGGECWCRSSRILSHHENRNDCAMILNHGLSVSGSVVNQTLIRVSSFVDVKKKKKKLMVTNPSATLSSVLPGQPTAQHRLRLCSHGNPRAQQTQAHSQLCIHTMHQTHTHKRRKTSAIS